MKIIVTIDYPDEVIEQYGAGDALATVLARLDEVYPGPIESGECLPLRGLVHAHMSTSP